MLRNTVALAIGVALISSLPVIAQEVSAGVTGLVTDPSGSAIPSATVSMKDNDRGTDWAAKTNTDGIFNFPRVPVGNYTVSVEAAGFKKYIQPSLTLEVNQRARIDAQMQVGAISDSVNVTDEATALQ